MPTMTNGRRKLLIGVAAVVVVLVALAAFGVWWFLKDDAPDEVDLADAVAVAGGQQAEDGASDGDAGDPPATVDGIEGRWSVDTSIGSFTFEEATGSFAGFRVQEELSGIGSATAVGRTGAVSGELEIVGSSLVSTTVVADLSRITTNDSRRDNRARGALDTAAFPEAVFALTTPVELGASVEDGSPVSVEVEGDLTIRGVTRPTTFSVEAQLVGDVIAVVGSTEVVFSDFGVQVPSAPIVVSAEDHGVVEFQLLFTRG